MVDLATSAILDSNKCRIEIPIDEEDLLKQQQMKKKEANAQWDAIEDRMTHASGSASSRELGWIDDVPAYKQNHRGCSPTASAMVLGYWDDQGYPNFPGEASLIGELIDAMDTSEWPRVLGETWPWDIDNGIETVCEDHGYNNFDATNDYLPSWNEVKNEVNQNRPFVISMLQGGIGSGHTQAYGDHSVTCLGYSDSTEDYIFIHDTWDKNTHHIAFGNWWAAMGTWVVP